MILIDTHVLIWSSVGSDRLGQGCRAELEAAQFRSALWMSPISAWEIAMLCDRGRLRLTMSTHAWIVRSAGDHDLHWAGLTPEIAVAAGELPGDVHGDPADRLIIATARALGCPLMTADRGILAYAGAGHLAAIDARL